MWKKLPDLHFNIVNHQTIKINNSIYIIGGSKSSFSQSFDKISVYILSRANYFVQLTKIETFQWDCIEDKIIRLENNINPVDRFGHTMIEWKDSGILFGGYCDDGYCEADVYLFITGNSFIKNVGTTGERWLKVSGIRGSVPLRRDGHSAVINNDKMFVYGGLTVYQSKQYDNKLYQLDLKSWQWSIINNGDYLEPLGRDFCQLLVHRNVLYLIGGRSDNCFHGHSNEDVYDTALWKFDLNQSSRIRNWKNIHPGYGIICDTLLDNNQSCAERYSVMMISCPQPRRSFMATILKDEIILFGGVYENRDLSIHFNDVWSFNIYQRQWICLSSLILNETQNQTPVPLRKGSITTLNNYSLLIIGGVTTNSVATANNPKIVGKSLRFPTNSNPNDFNFVKGVSMISSTCNISRTPVTLFHNTDIPFLGSIETINDLTLKSTSHVHLLQPHISLYQKALSIVVTFYTLNQLRSYYIPSKIMMDIETISIFPNTA